MLERILEFFKKKGWGERFAIGRKKAKKVLEKFRKEDRYELDKDALELLEFYGVDVAEFRVARSIDDVYVAAKEIGYPVVLKTLTSRAVHRWDAGGVEVVRSKEEIKEAYPKVLGEIFTRMPWLILEGVLVQELVEGDTKYWFRFEREKRIVLPFNVRLKIEGKEGVNETERIFKSEKELEELEKVEDAFLGLYVFFAHFPELRKLEADFVERNGEKILVDAKIYMFES